MSPAEFIAARNTLGMSAIQLADWLGVSRKSTTRWASGSSIPGPVARALRLAAALRDARAHIVWWAEEHGCCYGAQDDTLAKIDADLAPLLAMEGGE